MFMAVELCAALMNEVTTIKLAQQKLRKFDINRILYS